MNPYTIINKYYPQENELKHLLLVHSHAVAHKAVEMARLHPELRMDAAFIEEAALLHDIGIFLTNAPSIYCFGSEPYIRHGLLGARLMREEGYPRHAWVCERHTGIGLTKEEIIKQQLPLPHQDFVPVSLEEQAICFADTFYSKTHHLTEARTLEEVVKAQSRFDENAPKIIDKWSKMFL